jgi:hypothetical protein
MVAAALELWRAGQFYARSDHGQRFASGQTRFRELRRLLPGHGVVGYLSDKPDAVVTYFLAQYALAPLVLERGAARPVVAGTAALSPPDSAGWLDLQQRGGVEGQPEAKPERAIGGRDDPGRLQ